MLVRPQWTDDEDALLLARAGEPTRIVAQLLGRSVWAVYQRWALLKREGRA